MKPDTILIAITCADASVALMQFVTAEYTTKGITRWLREPTDKAIGAEIARAALSFDAEKLPVKGWRRITPEEVPTDRTFRNALKDDGTKLYHDMPRARDIHRDHLREARAPILASLDVAYQRADERRDKAEKTRVIALKQELRDLPAHLAIEAAQTTDELKAVWHEALK